eukprot:gb/GECH01012330.1/.p1 GENE.gb/GECH01012330.1/~~gb/GECH01012330.1/.p1  ORF type:complete len:328 (+),score=61.93 gb/GECH01012330.1/:1-984(+)
MYFSSSKLLLLLSLLGFIFTIPLYTHQVSSSNIGSLYSILLNHDDKCIFGRIDIVNKITGQRIHNFTQITPKNDDEMTLNVSPLNTVMDCSAIKGLFARTSVYSEQDSSFYWSPGYHEGGTYTIRLSGTPPHERSKVSSPFNAGGVWAMAYDDKNEVVYQLDSNRLLNVKPSQQQSKLVASWNNTKLNLEPAATESIFYDDHFYFVHSNRKDLVSVDVSHNETKLIKCAEELLDIQINTLSNTFYAINKGDGCIDIQHFTNIDACKYEPVVKIQDSSALVTTDQQGNLLFVATYDYLHIIDLSSKETASISGSVMPLLVSFQFAPRN